MTPEKEEEIAEVIRRRRRQILVHSTIYYILNDNIISDHTWSEWAHELVEYQNKYPEIADKQIYADAFRGFDGSTGFDLPITDDYPMMIAHHLLNYRDRELNK